MGDDGIRVGFLEEDDSFERECWMAEINESCP